MSVRHVVISMTVNGVGVRVGTIGARCVDPVPCHAIAAFNQGIYDMLTVKALADKKRLSVTVAAQQNTSNLKRK